MTYNNSLDNLFYISNNRDIIKLSEFEINLLLIDYKLIRI